MFQCFWKRNFVKTVVKKILTKKFDFTYIFLYIYDILNTFCAKKMSKVAETERFIAVWEEEEALWNVKAEKNKIIEEKTKGFQRFTHWIFKEF